MHTPMPSRPCFAAAAPSFYSLQAFQQDQAYQRRITCTTVYGLAWSPGSSSSCRRHENNMNDNKDDEGGRYLVACTSHGTICIWDIQREQRLLEGTKQEERERKQQQQQQEEKQRKNNKRRRKRHDDHHVKWWWQNDNDNDNDKPHNSNNNKSDDSDDEFDAHNRRRWKTKKRVKQRGEPVLSFTASPNTNNNNNNNARSSYCGPLYDVQFHRINNITFLITSGTAGVMLYKWSDILHHLLQQEQNDNDNHDIPTPVQTFSPHPTPMFATAATAASSNIHQKYKHKHNRSSRMTATTTTEINSTSCDTVRHMLYGAAGDGFGCYRWDVATGRLLGTLTAHTDYLHVVKVAQATTAENDEPPPPASVVFTGGEDGQLGVWDAKDGHLIDLLPCRTSSSTTTTPSSSHWHVSSIDVDHDANWMIAGGGRGGGGGGGGGFLSQWHVPTRSFTCFSNTRECIQSVSYYHHQTNKRSVGGGGGVDSSSSDELDHVYHENRIVTVGNESIVSFWSPSTSISSSSTTTTTTTTTNYNHATTTTLPSFTRRERVWSNPPSSYATSVCPTSGMVAVGGAGHVVDCHVNVGGCRAFGLLVL